MTNVEALKALYHALGGDLDDVADVNTIVGVLNAISAKFDGADDAELNSQGIANITDIIGNITADLTTLDVTPTTEEQNIKPTAPIDGYNEVNVNAVTAAIDSNITAGNIKSDISILGVVGSLQELKLVASPTNFGLLTNISDLECKIPDGVTGITGSAFKSCRGLLSVEIPDGVTTIGNYAFDGCISLSQIDLPNGIESLGSNAFGSCTALESIEIPNSVTSIANNTFSGCTNLTTITIHKSEGSITGAPWGAPNTTTVVWDG